jgi:hypothetical protein
MADLTNPNALGQMITGYWRSQAIYAAAKLGIADLLSDGPRAVDDLAQATSTKAPWLYRLLRALASVGVFAEDTQGRFELTPLADLLRSDVEGSQRALALMMGEEHYAVWGQLAHVLRTGENAFEKLFGQPIFDFMADHPEQGQVFDAAMTGIHGRETAAMLAAYDFSQFQTLADIGGGNGTTIARVLQHCPALRGVLFDLPHVVGRATKTIQSAGVADRCTLVGGSFFESVPQGGDAYLMRHIIHDWDDEKSLAILRSCQRAMRAGSKLLVVESVIPPGNGPFQGKFLDLTMMLIPGGQERTADEYSRLFDQAGFDLTRIVPTSLEVSVIEGVRR